MARDINTIFNAMLADKTARTELNGLTSTSSVSIWRLLLYICAVGIWTLEKLFDALVVEVKGLLANQKTLRLSWYANMAKNYQHGDSLVPDKDYYDNTGIDDATIAAKKVVQYASCQDVGTTLRLKVARSVSGALAPLTSAQLLGLQAYFAKVKAAGVFIQFVNSTPDNIRMTLKIYYDPSVLDSSGARLDGTSSTPVQDAINDYLQNDIAFDGYFVTSKLIDKLQEVDGVKIPSMVICQAQFGLLPWFNINEFYNPDAGYLKLAPSDLTLSFTSSPF